MPPSAASSSFDRLSGDIAILSLVFECLGLQATIAVRAVCRQWRDAAEAITWRHLDIDAESPKKALRLSYLVLLPQDVKEKMTAGEYRPRRWIRVAPGASLRIRVQEPEFDPLLGGPPAPSACYFVGRCVDASGGLGDVEVDSQQYRFCVLCVLPYIAPRDGAACPTLRRLALQGREYCFACLDPPTGPDIPKHFLRPFPNLARLSLPDCFVADRSVASDLAQCLPRLEQLKIGLKDAGAAAGLAALPSLELLELHTSQRDGPVDAGRLIAALASGPLALSLKELCFDAVLTGPALRSLPRLVALRRLFFGGLGTELGPEVGEGDLAALGVCPALEAVGQLFLPDDERSRTLSALGLLLGGTATPPAAREALAALAGAAPGRLRLSLTLHLTVDVDEPESVYRGLAAALAATPPSRLALLILLKSDADPAEVIGRLSSFSGCIAEGPLICLAFERDASSSADLDVHMVAVPPSTSLAPRIQATQAKAAEALARALPAARFGGKDDVYDWQCWPAPRPAPLPPAPAPGPGPGPVLRFGTLRCGSLAIDLRHLRIVLRLHLTDDRTQLQAAGGAGIRGHGSGGSGGRTRGRGQDRPLVLEGPPLPPQLVY